MVISSYTKLLRRLAAGDPRLRRRKSGTSTCESLEYRWLLSGNSLANHGEVSDDDFAAHHVETEPHSFPLPTADVILATSGPPAPAPASLDATYRLHSNPDALHTIYLDFNGHTATNTQWNVWKSIPTITTAAWDPSGDGTPTNATEQAMIQGIWQRVAEDFAPFNVNVTTQDPGPEAFKKSGGADDRWGIRVVITPTDWSLSRVGGHAWIGSFNSAVDEACYVYNTTEITVAAAVSHEVGHAMFLDHDGQNSTTYYNGHGTGETSWGPIMGSGYYSNVTTWDNGTYFNANNNVAGNYTNGADDFAVITTKNGFGYLADDYGGSQNDATTMTYTGTNAVEPVRYDVGTFGVIGQGTDQDFFRFTVGTGTIDLTVDSYYSRYYASNGDGTFDLGYAQTPVGSATVNSQGSNLDVLARLYDLAGNVVATSNPTGLSAGFNGLYLQAGTYFLEVDGTGFGNWAANPPTGYGNLVSVGQYYIRGTVVKPGSENTNPVANPESFVIKTNTPISFNVIGNDGDAEGDPISVSSITQPANGTVTWTASGVMTYTPSLHFVGADSFTYTITDGRGGSGITTVSFEVQATIAPALGNGRRFKAGEAIRIDFSGGAANPGDRIAIYASGAVPGTDAPVAWSYTNGTQTLGSAVPTGTVVVNGSIGTWPLASGGYFVTFLREGGFNELAPRGSFEINFRPITVDDFLTVNEDSLYTTFDLIANDSDPDGNWFNLISVGTPGHGVVQRYIGGGPYHYTPNPNYNGPDSFTYTIQDAIGDITTGTMYVTVLPVNDAPITVVDNVTAVEETPAVFDVMANDFDLEGDAFTLTAKTNGTKGSVAINGDGTLTYSPNFNAYGPDTFTYTVNDGIGGARVGTVNVTITGTQDPPTAINDSAVINENTSAHFNVFWNDRDPDGDALTIVSMTNPSHGTVTINPTGGNGIYTPFANYIGTDSFQYTISDGHGHFATATMSINVLWVNDPPIAGEDSATTVEETPVTIAVLTNDSDIDGATLSITNRTNGAKGTTIIVGNSVRYTPNVNAVGTDTFTYTVSDGQGGSTVGSVTVTITPVNDAPTAVANSAATDEDAPITFNVLSNDSDIDGDALAVSNWTNPAHGTVSITAAGAATYSPTFGYIGADSFTYTIADPSGLTSTATVSITVRAVADLSLDKVSYLSGESISAIFDDGPGNASDWLGIYKSDTTPASGSYLNRLYTNNTTSPGGNLTAGTVTFGSNSGSWPLSNGNYYVAYLSGATTTELARTYFVINAPPVAQADSPKTNEDTAITFDVLSNDTDPDSLNALTLVSITTPAHGTAEIIGNTVRYTPAANFYGEDIFHYTIRDAYGATSSAEIKMTVEPVKDPPTAVADSATTSENTAVLIAVLANDTDPDTGNSSLKVTSSTNGSKGTVEIINDTQVRYSPNANTSGTDTFTYTVDDGDGGFSIGTVTVTITQANQLPTVVNDSVTTNEDTPINVLALSNDSDIDGGTLTITARTNGTRGTVVIVGGNSVTYTPNANINGTDSFTYTVSDGQGGTRVGTVNVTITAVNDAPVAVNDTASTTGTTPVTISVMTNDSDADANPLIPQLASSPANGNAVVNANGTITYTANLGFAGTDTFTYRADDSQATSGLATVTITVYGPTKFTVIDNGTDRSYRYDANGGFTTSTATNTLNRGAVGMAASADGTRLWVLDGNRNVYVYDANMTLLGSWTASGLTTPKGISVHGSDVWVVDTGTDRVYLYSGATTRLSGSQTAARNFLLPTTNRNPEDLVTDGTTIWVLQSGSPDRVFAYRNTDGVALGNWTIDVANTNPVGITLDPTGASQSLWIVDGARDRVYEYANARSLLTGTHLATSSFALGSGNITPQGIAWIGTPASGPAGTQLPPTGDGLPTTTDQPRIAEDDDGEADNDDDRSTTSSSTASSIQRSDIGPSNARRESASSNRAWMSSLDSLFEDSSLAWGS